MVNRMRMFYPDSEPVLAVRFFINAEVSYVE
jgi:hypothetical protein